MYNFYNGDELTAALVHMVKVRESEGISIERILNESGIAGGSIYSRVETRARVLYRLGIGVAPDRLLEKAICYFIADQPVFRWSELRHHFQSNMEQEIEAILYKLKYSSRYLAQEGEYVWAPKRMWSITVKRHLRRRAPLGDQVLFDYLTYKPPEKAHHEL